jgi:hypothetical protein
VPRLNIFGQWTSRPWSRDQAVTVEKIRKSQADTAAEKTQSQPKALNIQVETLVGRSRERP